MKIILWLAAIGLSAAPLPNMTIDGLGVPRNDPRIGALVYAFPLSTWEVFGNDNRPPGGDLDFNDAKLDIHFSATGVGYASWGGSNSQLNNTWIIQGVVVDKRYVNVFFPWVIDGPLSLSLRTGDGRMYAIGSRNILVQHPTPEPGTWLMIGAGLVLVAMRRVRTPGA